MDWMPLLLVRKVNSCTKIGTETAGTKMTEAHLIGIDIAKRVFQAHVLGSYAGT